MKRILITGGTGLIGQKLTSHLEEKGYEVAWLSRRIQERKSYLWNLEKSHIDADSVDEMDAAIRCKCLRAMMGLEIEGSNKTDMVHIEALGKGKLFIVWWCSVS